jgi:hypothetical protein
MAKKEAQQQATAPEPKVEEKPRRFVKVEDISFVSFEFADRARREMKPSADERLRVRRRSDGTFSLFVKRAEGKK